MKIKIVVELDERCRRAIAHHIGEKGPASYRDCKNHIEAAIDGDLETICADYQEQVEEAKK